MPQIQVLPKSGPTSRERLGAGVAAGLGAIGKGLQTASEYQYRSEIESAKQDLRDKAMVHSFRNTLAKFSDNPQMQQYLLEGFKLAQPDLYPGAVSGLPLNLPKSVIRETENAITDIRKMTDKGEARELLGKWVESMIPRYPGNRKKLQEFIQTSFSTIQFQSSASGTDKDEDTSWDDWRGGGPWRC